jgi:hypothetical protein
MINFLFDRKKAISVVFDKILFWLENDGKLFIYDNQIKIIDIPEEYQAIEDGQQPSRLVYQQPYLYLTDNRGFIFSVIKNDKSIDILDFSRFRKSGINASRKPNFDQFHTLTQVNGENRRYVSLDFDSMTVTERFYPRESYEAFAGSRYYISRLKVGGGLWAVIALAPSTGEEAWRFDDFLNLGIDNFGKEKIEEVDQIFGVANDLLWVKLQYGRIIGLDPLTGKCIKSISPIDVDITDFERNGGEFDGPPWNSPIFLKEESRIVSLSYSRYAEIDLTAEKPVWICFDVKQEFDDKELYAGGHKTSYQHYIYFSESMSGVLGIFDRSSKKIIWSDDLKNHNPEAGMVLEIKATDTHLCVQDNRQNLYVFEHEAPVFTNELRKDC